MITRPIVLRVHYRIQGYLPKMRYVSVTDRYEDAAFLIRVVDDLEAPVAARLTRQTLDVQPGRPDHEFLWRLHDGRLYRSLLAADGKPTHVDAKGEPQFGRGCRTRAFLEGEDDQPFARHGSFREGVQQAIAPRESDMPGRFRQIVQDRRDQAFAIAAGKAQNLLVIGDVLYEEAPPPAWALKVRPGQPATIKAVVPGYDNLTSIRWLAEDGQQGDLQVMADALAESWLEKPRQADLQGKLESLLDMPYFDQRVWMAKSMMDRMLAYVVTRPLSQIDPPTAAGIAAIQFAAQALGRRGGPVDTGALELFADAAERLANLDDHYQIDALYYDWAKDHQDQRDNARECAKEWLMGCALCPPRITLDERAALDEVHELDGLKL